MSDKTRNHVLPNGMTVGEIEDRARPSELAAATGSAQRPPNKIHTQITAADRNSGKGISVAALAEECLEHLEWGCPYHTTFTNSIPLECRDAAEQELRKAYELWANTWLAPKLRRIIAKTAPNTKLTDPAQ